VTAESAALIIADRAPLFDASKLKGVALRKHQQAMAAAAATAATTAAAAKGKRLDPLAAPPPPPDDGLGPSGRGPWVLDWLLRCGFDPRDLIPAEGASAPAALTTDGATAGAGVGLAECWLSGPDESLPSHHQGHHGHHSHNSHHHHGAVTSPVAAPGAAEVAPAVSPSLAAAAASFLGLPGFPPFAETPLGGGNGGGPAAGALTATSNTLGSGAGGGAGSRPGSRGMLAAALFASVEHDGGGGGGGASRAPPAATDVFKRGPEADAAAAWAAGGVVWKPPLAGNSHLDRVVLLALFYACGGDPNHEGNGEALLGGGWGLGGGGDVALGLGGREGHGHVHHGGHGRAHRDHHGHLAPSAGGTEAAAFFPTSSSLHARAASHKGSGAWAAAAAAFSTSGTSSSHGLGHGHGALATHTPARTHAHKCARLQCSGALVLGQI